MEKFTRTASLQNQADDDDGRAKERANHLEDAAEVSARGNRVKCVRCGKPLMAPSVTVMTRSGPQAWGPKCAKLAGFVEPSLSKAKPAEHTKDPRQMDLI